MSLAAFLQPAPPFLQVFDTFVANVVHHHRFLLTFKDGAHLVGVPTARTSEDATNPDAMFDVTTAIHTYTIPFKLLAYAQQLVESGLRASDGQAPVPEPCRGPMQRAKHDKFSILDSPRLLVDDLAAASPGLLGTTIVFLDIDHFKVLNTRHTERVIDRTVLPEFQRLIAAAVQHHGFAYAEGGDEVIILLPNFSEALAAAFAEELRQRIADHAFAIDGGNAGITVSIASRRPRPSRRTYRNGQISPRHRPSNGEETAL